MKKVQNFGLLCLMALVTVFFFWASSIFGSEVFIPYVMATAFTGVFLFLAAFATQENKERLLTTICTMVMSMVLFSIARWMDMDQTEFYNSQSWDGCEHVPSLAVITWGWKVQIVLTCVWGWISWKYYESIAKLGEEETVKESTGSRL